MSCEGVSQADGPRVSAPPPGGDSDPNEIIPRTRLVRAQLFCFLVKTDTFEGLRLDLPNALARDPELAADLFQRATAAIVQPEPQL